MDLDVVAACVRNVIASEQRLLTDAALGPRCGGVTASGHPIVIESTESPWDHLEDGRAVRHIEYRVSSPACAQDVVFTVENTVGGHG